MSDNTYANDRAARAADGNSGLGVKLYADSTSIESNGNVYDNGQQDGKALRKAGVLPHVTFTDSPGHSNNQPHPVKNGNSREEAGTIPKPKLPAGSACERHPTDDSPSSSETSREHVLMDVIEVLCGPVDSLPGPVPPEVQHRKDVEQVRNDIRRLLESQDILEVPAAAGALLIDWFRLENPDVHGRFFTAEK